MGKEKKGWFREMQVRVSTCQSNGNGVSCVTAPSLLPPEAVPDPGGNPELLHSLQNPCRSGGK